MTTLSPRARTTAVALVAVLSLASCGTAASFPDTAPDARGTLAPYEYDPVSSAGPDTVVFHLTVEEDAYSYFQDAVLNIDDHTVIGDQSGVTLNKGDLSAGLWVEVWTDSCRESYPVQCDVTHIRLARVD
jgi:hypothetical protein